MPEREYQDAADACGWVPAPRAQPARTPVVEYGPPRPGSRVIVRDAPRLPAMPAMLPEEPAEAAYSAAALRAMMGTDYANDAQTAALGGAIRAATVGALLLGVSTAAWAAAYLAWPSVRAWHVLIAWGLALLLTVAYTLASERAARHYSAAGVERLKIETAAQMHRDRLEARAAMHQAATEAWQDVMSKALEKWQ